MCALNWTEADLKRYQKRITTNTPVATPMSISAEQYQMLLAFEGKSSINKALKAVLGEDKKAQKYRNKITIVDDIKFQSEKEANKYIELKLLKKAGEIIDFELQPKYLLLKGFDKINKETGKKEHFRPIYYNADFKVINKDGSVTIIDTKGIKTDVFKLKRKLFEDTYPEFSLLVI